LRKWIPKRFKRRGKKMDAGQRQVTNQGTTQSYKRRRFIMTFPLMLFFI